MTYNEFDKKYNKRNAYGVILETSIIDLDGNIVFHGTLAEVEKYWDENVEPIWDSQLIGSIGDMIDGKEVITTNLANYSWYKSPDFKKLHFEVKL